MSILFILGTIKISKQKIVHISKVDICMSIYVLDHSNTGIKIYQKKNGVFKEQRTTKTNNN
jgi:hypothetical protein